MFQERVWGRRNLDPFFSPSKEPIGEVWFTHEKNQTIFGNSLGDLLREHPEVLGEAADPEHPGICPLLVKLLFTTERLSVQVHPDDEYAQEHHGCLGKTEAWYVMDSQPPGEVAVGFKRELSRENLKEAARSGEIESLLDWRVVHEGDAIYTPAGTVHAIGAGLTICEIQENSDITYRLYDYGRPRELHLEHGVAVSHLGPHQYDSKPVTVTPGRDEMVVSDYFRIERLRTTGQIEFAGGWPYYLLLICLKGKGKLGEEEFEPGKVWLVPAGADPFTLNGESEWIVSYKADERAKLFKC